ncbi:MAG: peptide deformylase [Candidatus Omnitrophota bacterium]
MRETGLRIRTIGESVLVNGVRQVEEVKDFHRKILSQMARLMYEVSGIGLAAPQVGLDEALIVVDIGTGLYKLVNPKIVKIEGAQSIEEGCLSVPGIGVKVKRAKKIIIEAQDEFGKNVVIEAEDLLACVFQHEIDHLNGRLIIDYLPSSERNKVIKNL